MILTLSFTILSGMRTNKNKPKELAALESLLKLRESGKCLMFRSRVVRAELETTIWEDVLASQTIWTSLFTKSFYSEVFPTKMLTILRTLSPITATCF